MCRILNARYEKIRHGDSVVSCAALMAFGVDETGHRTAQGVSVSLSEAEVHWRDFFAHLQECGLNRVRLLINDDLPASGARGGFPAYRGNAASSPAAERQTLRAANRDAPRGGCGSGGIFESTDRLEAERRLRQAVDNARSASKLSAWMELKVTESFTVFAFPETHRRQLRTSNLMERISKELKRRTRVATLFPNEASLLRLVSAVLMEISAEWETEKTY